MMTWIGFLSGIKFTRRWNHRIIFQGRRKCQPYHQIASLHWITSKWIERMQWLQWTIKWTYLLLVLWRMLLVNKIVSTKFLQLLMEEWRKVICKIPLKQSLNSYVPNLISQLKGSTIKINQYLNTNFVVSSFIKPGANIKQIVHSQELEFKCLGKKDISVINGGTNDLDNNSEKRKSAVVHMLQFAQKYVNTNIIMVNTPLRHNLAMDSQINFEIQDFNMKLSKSYWGMLNWWKWILIGSISLSMAFT